MWKQSYGSKLNPLSHRYLVATGIHILRGWLSHRHQCDSSWVWCTEFIDFHRKSIFDFVIVVLRQTTGYFQVLFFCCWVPEGWCLCHHCFTVLYDVWVILSSQLWLVEDNCSSLSLAPFPPFPFHLPISLHNSLEAHYMCDELSKVRTGVIVIILLWVHRRTEPIKMMATVYNRHEQGLKGLGLGFY
jgi:hypothetical protein